MVLVPDSWTDWLSKDWVKWSNECFDVLSDDGIVYDADMAEYWETIIRWNMDIFRTYVTNPALFSLIDNLWEKLNVLDAWCGEWYVSRYLVERWHNVVWIDLSPHMVDLSTSAWVWDEIYRQWDITSLKDFEDGSLDLVVSNFVIMELPDPSLAIKAISRVLKPGWILIFQWLHPFTFASNSWKTEWKHVLDYFKRQRYSEKFEVWWLISPKESVRYHHPLSEYTSALKNNGFIIESLEEPSPIDSTPEDNIVWDIFKDPWILLVQAKKVS